MITNGKIHTEVRCRLGMDAGACGREDRYSQMSKLLEEMQQLEREHGNTAWILRIREDEITPCNFDGTKFYFEAAPTIAI